MIDNCLILIQIEKIKFTVEIVLEAKYELNSPYYQYNGFFFVGIS
ncbi:MAG: hypothetical protein AAF487_02120 [Bacteroidota bacterium]